MKYSKHLLTLGILLLTLGACGNATPAAAPTAVPTQAVASLVPPTAAATTAPTAMPATAVPPTAAPTAVPTAAPTAVPTAAPTAVPATAVPATAVPPTAAPTAVPATAVPPPAQPAGFAAEIKLFQFQPGVIEVAVGTSVTWNNADAIEHSVTAGAPGSPSGAFDSGFFTQGQAYSHTFDQPGEYAYFCARHTSMTGIVKVNP